MQKEQRPYAEVDGKNQKKKRAGSFFVNKGKEKKRGKVDVVFGLVVWWFGDAT